jgi:hypothetical protein
MSRVDPIFGYVPCGEQGMSEDPALSYRRDACNLLMITQILRFAQDDNLEERLLSIRDAPVTSVTTLSLPTHSKPD